MLEVSVPTFSDIGHFDLTPGQGLLSLVASERFGVREVSACSEKQFAAGLVRPISTSCSALIASIFLNPIASQVNLSFRAIDCTETHGGDSKETTFLIRSLSHYPIQKSRPSITLGGFVMLLPDINPASILSITELECKAWWTQP